MKRIIYLSCICMALCLCLVGCKKNNDKTAYDEKDLREIQINLVANAYEKNPKLYEQTRQIDQTKYALDQERLEKKLEDTVKKFHKECGKIKSIKKDTECSYVNGEINVTTTLDCTKRDATVTSLYKFDEETTELHVEREYSFTGEWTDEDAWDAMTDGQYGDYLGPGWDMERFGY